MVILGWCLLMLAFTLLTFTTDDRYRYNPIIDNEETHMMINFIALISFVIAGLLF